MNREPDERADGGLHGDGFDAIVAGWRREGRVPEWPDDDRGPVDQREPEPPLPGITPQPGTAPQPDITSQPGTADEGHFIPPEPPPLPRIGPPVIVGLVLLGLGLVLVTTPSWVGVPASYGLPLGLLCLAAGLGWLVLRLWPTPAPHGDDDRPDNGAVV